MNEIGTHKIVLYKRSSNHFSQLSLCINENGEAETIVGGARWQTQDSPREQLTLQLRYVWC